MAVKKFLDHAGTAITFDPLVDSLEFPSGHAAARVVLAVVDGNTAVSYTDTSATPNVTRTVTLTGVQPEQLGSAQLSFTGSVFVRASGLTAGGAGGDQLVGGEGADELLGLDGDDSLAGGAGADSLVGGAGKDTLDGGTGAERDTLVGGAGDDTYIVDGTDTVTEEAGGGTDTVLSSVGGTLGAQLENLTLTGALDLDGTGNELANQVTGNAGANTLKGEAGNDTLDGGAGADILEGGLGDDTLHVDHLDDEVAEAASAGTDTVVASVAAYTLGANVENLTLAGDAASGTGNSLANRITGNAGVDTLSGLAGNDTLDGGAGADSMLGGTGNDTYTVDDAADVVSEVGGSGTDTVITSIDNYILGAAIENLTISGAVGRSGTGNTLANVLTGGTGNDTLAGLDGNDTLDGGDGSDSLTGGTGNDTYMVNAAGDVVTEVDGGGTDSVMSSVTRTLGAHVENLTLTGSGNINGTGNDLANKLTGNSGKNDLNGGAGNDTLTGGDGDDTYHVAESGDQVIEGNGSSSGTDTVVTGRWSYALGANVENLTLTGAATVHSKGTGNTLANKIIGNAGNNLLVGGTGNDTLDGGEGNDTLDGGAGNDTYVYGAGDILVAETATGGVDTIETSLDGKVLSDIGANLENLTLTGTAVTGTGNALANVLRGNAQANRLLGEAGNDTISAGEGNDTLEGGIGNDTLAGEAGNDSLVGGAGTDSMTGGLGDDTYVVEDAGDAVSEAEGTGSGTDKVVSHLASYTLAVNVENLELAGAASEGIGNALANRITGNAGIDRLEGKAGNDTYVVDDEDVVVEADDGGTDTIESGGNILELDANVENLVLTGSANSIGNGNALANHITSNAGSNVLAGGAGDDTYVVNTAAAGESVPGDSVVELADEGNDTVRSSIDFILAANIENLVLTGAEALDGTGNALDNALTGNEGINYLEGEAGNDTLDGLGGADSLDGGGGDDTYVVDQAGDVVIEAEGGGNDTVRSSVTLILGAHVENLTLTGTQAIHATGNGLANTLKGNSAGNVLDGKAGADAMEGGAGSDTYRVDDAGDVVTETDATDSGTDTVISTLAAYTLAANVENLVIEAIGAADGTGNALANLLTGNASANVLTGLGGNDTYAIDALDTIVEAEGGGTDTVRIGSSYVLAAALENLTLTGSDSIDGTGNAADNFLRGNTGNNRLVGLDGNDTLEGTGGVDTLEGGAGNDRYVMDTTDVVTELADGGIDTVVIATSYTLGANWEHLELMGADSLTGIGNDSDNTITGNSGKNALGGQGGNDSLAGGAGDDTLHGDDGNDTLDGGAGSDRLEGGLGNDTYVVDVAGDEILSETEASGIDTVVSAITKVLGEHLEHLTLSGTAAIDATGNAANNLIRGNTGANVLRGLAGTDTLEGGDGDDTYHVDDAGDVINESDTVSGGNDTVVTAFNGYSLAGRANVENLTLTGNARVGVGNDHANRLKGNDLANDLVGNGGDDTLDGGGGVDTLRGGAGNDTYIVDTASDQISEEAESGADTIVASFTISLMDTVTGGAEPARRWANFEHLTLGGTTAINATGDDSLIQGNKLVGNSAANVLDGRGGNDTMEGGGGNDTYHVDAAGDVVTETDSTTAGGTDLVVTRLGTYILGANVENLRFEGNDTVLGATGTGNSLANTLTSGAGRDVLDGGTGNDTLDGGAGVDTMKGGTGNDTYHVDDEDDLLEESSATDGGNDRVNSSVTWVLDKDTEGVDRFESLVLTGTANINGTGNSLANQMVGNNGHNILDGKEGADILIGGAGNDIYYAGSTDQIFENADGGIDTVRTDATSWALAGTLENLEFLKTTAAQGVGNALANRLQGNAGNDFLDGSLGNDELRGLAGNDTLFGGIDNDKVYGGTGKDHISGGAGNDTLSGEDSNDAMFGGSGTDSLLGGAGDDLLFADGDGLKTGNTYDSKTTTNALKGGAGNDQLSGGIGLDKLWGEDGNDRLVGGAGKDALDGGAGKDVLDGGTGYDTMTGGTGDDTYYVDSKYDVVTESRSSSGGIDTIVSSVSRVLGSYQENLLMAGKSNLSATGNTLANKLFGNDGNNVMNGGSGADTMVGGKGNDTYYVDNMKDAIGEAKSGGTDQVYASVSFGLGSYQENLTLTGTAHATGAGNTLDNVLRGNSGNNSLISNGGKDTMVGGKGNDTYYVDGNDVVVEARGGGTDLLVTTGSRTLGAYEENLMFQGTKGLKGTGNTLDNVLLGGAGGDLLDGAAGNDQVLGQAGNDTLRGGDGHDRLVGGLGKDYLTGGAGNDRFAWTLAAESTRSNFDVITDFRAGADKIDVSMLDANDAVRGVQDWSFIGSNAFTGNATGQLRFAYEPSTGSVMVYGSTDADTSAEIAFQVAGITGLSGSDFLG